MRPPCFATEKAKLFVLIRLFRSCDDLLHPPQDAVLLHSSQNTCHSSFSFGQRLSYCSPNTRYFSEHLVCFFQALQKIFPLPVPQGHSKIRVDKFCSCLRTPLDQQTNVLRIVLQKGRTGISSTPAKIPRARRRSSVCSRREEEGACGSSCSARRSCGVVMVSLTSAGAYPLICSSRSMSRSTRLLLVAMLTPKE